MTKLNMAPTKSNLLKVKEQLSISMDGYELLEQKREILVMELMHMVEQIKLLEREIDKLIAFSTVDMGLPKRQLFYSFMDSFADTDKVMADFFDFLKLLTQMASIRTIVWRLAMEVKKTQRRVNALDKMIIPQARNTKKYIESVLEERERENVFVLKSLKGKKGGDGT